MKRVQHYSVFADAANEAVDRRPNWAEASVIFTKRDGGYFVKHYRDFMSASVSKAAWNNKGGKAYLYAEP